MAPVCTDGGMDASTKATLRMIYDTVKDDFTGSMEPPIKEHLRKGNRKEREFAPSRVENTLVNSIEVNITDTEVSEYVMWTWIMSVCQRDFASLCVCIPTWLLEIILTILQCALTLHRMYL